MQEDQPMFKEFEAKVKLCIMYLTDIEHFKRKIEQASLDNWSTSEIEERLLALSHYQQQWDNAIVELTYCSDASPEHTQNLQAKSASVEEICIELKAKLKDISQAKQPKMQNQNAGDEQALQASNQGLPVHTNHTPSQFSGRYCDWPEFKEYFVKNVVQ